MATLFVQSLDVDEACWPWKRCGKNLVQFTVCRSSVDASLLQVVANLSPALRQAFAAMTAAFPNVADVPMVLLVQVFLAQWPKHADAFYQLAWQLGQRLDDISVASMQVKHLQCDSFSVSKADPLVFGNSPAMDNRLLVAYSCVTLRTFKSQQDLSIAYDKGRMVCLSHLPMPVHGASSGQLTEILRFDFPYVNFCLLSSMSETNGQATTQASKQIHIKLFHLPLCCFSSFSCVN